MVLIGYKLHAFELVWDENQKKKSVIFIQFGTTSLKYWEIKIDNNTCAIGFCGGIFKL